MIGLGNMGGRIARRIKAAGRPCSGYDRSPSQAQAAGIAIRPASIAELAADSDVVFLSLPDSRVVEAVVFGEGGLLESARAGHHRGRPEHRGAELDREDPRGAGRARRRLRRRRHLRRRRRGRAGHARDHGGRLAAGARRGCAAPRDLQRPRLPHGRIRLGARRQAAEQLPQRDQPRRDGRGDGRGEAGRSRPGAVPRRRQPLERRQLRDAQPLPEDHRGRLPRGRPDERADGEGRPALPRVPAADRGHELHRRRLSRRVQSRRRARLRRSDQQPRGRRDRRCRRWRPHPADRGGRIMRIARGRTHGKPTEQRGPTFTGRVWADPVLGGEDGIMVDNVFFEPGCAHALAHARDGAGAARARRRGPGAVARRHRARSCTPATRCTSRRARSTGTAPRPAATCCTSPSRWETPTGWMPVSDEDYVRATGSS